MDKKTIAYILIGGGVAAAIYYFYRQSKANAAAGALGAGAADTRGIWAADDDALYKKFRSQFTEPELGWIDPLVKQAYETSAYGSGVACGDDTKIKGQASKAGAFACVIYGVAPNTDGTNPPLHWAPNTPSLWPKAKIDGIWSDLNKLKVKYGGL
jgi:hypothetical protein